MRARAVLVLPLLVACAEVPQGADLETERGEGLIGGPDVSGGGGGDGTCASWAPGYGVFGGAVAESLITREPYDFDAGVAAVLDARPGQSEEATGLDLRIEDAVVTNVGAPRSGGPNVWFADEAGGLRTYGVPVPDGVEPGDRISMTITTLEDYAGELQIADATDISVRDSDDPVRVIDQTSGAVDYDSHGRQNIYLWGEVGPGGDGCGGSSVCFDLQASGQTFVLRIAEDQAPVQGACMALTLPLARFNTDLQLNIDNYDWRVEY